MNSALSRRSFSCCIGAAAALIASPANAQTYPAKPIRIIAAQTAGGGTDLFARLLGQKISESWKQPVVIENRPGAGGTIGNDITAKSAPDGYTLILATAGQMVINQNLYPDSGHDPLKELAPIVGGKGGGKADMAEGGGALPEKLNEALEASYGVIEKLLS